MHVRLPFRVGNTTPVRCEDIVVLWIKKWLTLQLLASVSFATLMCPRRRRVQGAATQTEDSSSSSDSESDFGPGLGLPPFVLPDPPAEPSEDEQPRRRAGCAAAPKGQAEDEQPRQRAGCATAPKGQAEGEQPRRRAGCAAASVGRAAAPAPATEAIAVPRHRLIGRASMARPTENEADSRWYAHG